MQTKRVSEQLAWLAVALAAAASALAQEPRQWLERMNQALTARNYDGVFSHWQDGRVEMLRIVHRNQNGQVTERLVRAAGFAPLVVGPLSTAKTFDPDTAVYVKDLTVSQTRAALGLPK